MVRYTLFATILLTFSCRTIEASKAKDETSDSDPYALRTCKNGAKAVPFTLEPMDPMPDASVVKFPGFDLHFRLESQIPNQKGARIDLCIDEVNGTVTFDRLVYKEDPFTPLTNLAINDSITQPQWKDNILEIPSSFVKIENLDKAAFGDAEGLFMWVKESGIEGRLVRSWKDGDKVFTTINLVQEQQQGGYRPLGAQALAGSFQPGDPFANGLCNAARGPQYSGTFKFDHVTMKFDACVYAGGGETTGYDIKRLEITDSAPQLTDDQRKPFTFQGAELESVFQVAWNHHNACDSFVLKLPHATYAATAAATAGCGTILEGAPHRTLEDPNPEVMYSVRYGGNEPAEGKVACRHFLLHCQQ
ncbi:MAG: hypothetical protein AB7T49_05680 [Oligoflexales bacterium]